MRARGARRGPRSPRTPSRTSSARSRQPSHVVERNDARASALERDEHGAPGGPARERTSARAAVRTPAGMGVAAPAPRPPPPARGGASRRSRLVVGRRLDVAAAPAPPAGTDSTCAAVTVVLDRELAPSVSWWNALVVVVVTTSNLVRFPQARQRYATTTEGYRHRGSPRPLRRARQPCPPVRCHDGDVPARRGCHVRDAADARGRSSGSPRRSPSRSSVASSRSSTSTRSSTIDVDRIAASTSTPSWQRVDVNAARWIDRSTSTAIVDAHRHQRHRGPDRHRRARGEGRPRPDHRPVDDGHARRVPRLPATRGRLARRAPRHRDVLPAPHRGQADRPRRPRRRGPGTGSRTARATTPAASPGSSRSSPTSARRGGSSCCSPPASSRRCGCSRATTTTLAEPPRRRHRRRRRVGLLRTSRCSGRSRAGRSAWRSSARAWSPTEGHAISGRAAVDPDARAAVLDRLLVRRARSRS